MSGVPPIASRGAEYDLIARDSAEPVQATSAGPTQASPLSLAPSTSRAGSSSITSDLDLDSTVGSLQDLAKGVVMLQLKLLQVVFTAPHCGRCHIEEVFGPEDIRVFLNPYNRLLRNSGLRGEQSWTFLALSSTRYASTDVQVARRKAEANEEQEHLLEEIHKFESGAVKEYRPAEIPAHRLPQKYRSCMDAAITDHLCGIELDLAGQVLIEEAYQIVRAQGSPTGEPELEESIRTERPAAPLQALAYDRFPTSSARHEPLLERADNGKRLNRTDHDGPKRKRR